jgi:hypothetical protein
MAKNAIREKMNGTEQEGRGQNGIGFEKTIAYCS